MIFLPLLLIAPFAWLVHGQPWYVVAQAVVFYLIVQLWWFGRCLRWSRSAL